MLVVNVKGHMDRAAALDVLCENAAQIAGRIGSEVAESARGQAVPAAAFDPGSLFEPSTGDVASEQFISRMFAVLIVVVVALAVGIAAISSSDDSDTSDSGPTAEGDAARLADITESCCA